MTLSAKKVTSVQVKKTHPTMEHSVNQGGHTHARLLSIESNT